MQMIAATEIIKAIWTINEIISKLNLAKSKYLPQLLQ